MPFGYHGKILRVDLNTSELNVEEPNEEFYRKYMGGSGLNLYYLLKEAKAGTDPFSAENILALSVGVTTGTPISGQSRLTATAKSPLTGAIGDSQSGGMFPAKMKFAGFDAMVIKGKAANPVYLVLDNGKAEIRDASNLWGKITGEVQESIQKEFGDDKIEVLQIGPAGEKQVRFAALINMCNRANGRTGMGAVMGSKNLKAIAVRGDMKPEVAEKDALNALVRWGAKTFPNSNVTALGKYGTSGIVSAQNDVGGLPTYNFNSGVFDGSESINGVTLYESFLAGSDEGKQESKGRDTCFGCIIRCKRVVEIVEGPYRVNPLYGGPEYETIAAIGSYCGIDNLSAICKANELCNQYGLDTISCGATIAWAMESFEAGIISKSDTGGMEIKFGDADTMVKLVQMIGERKGFGDMLAEGSQRAAKKLGGSKFLITCKSQEAPAHMPHVKRSLGLIYAVNPFGADHQSSDHDVFYDPDQFAGFKDRFSLLGLTTPQPAQVLNPEKVEFAVKTQFFYSFMDSINLCQFAWGPSWQLYGPEHFVPLVKAVTGWDVDMEEFLIVGERRLNMLRAFNSREGFDRGQDILPEKFFQRALEGGVSDGVKLKKREFEKALSEYYRLCGWDEKTGNPTRATLERLDLKWVADDLNV
jgi:aldehyde:ferredoxin oxidoreductase